MTDQQPPFTIAELGARFGAHQAQLLAELITLEKQIAAQGQNIQKLVQSEARLQGQIETIEAELNELRAENFDLAEIAEERRALADALKISEVSLGTRVQGLEAELNTLKSENSALKNGLSEWKREYGSEIDGIINEKAVP